MKFLFGEVVVKHLLRAKLPKLDLLKLEEVLDLFRN